MKMTIVTLFISALVGTNSFAATFDCKAPKNNPEAFFAESTVIVKLSGNNLRLQQFDAFGTSSKSLMRDCKYVFNKIVTGRGKTKGMMEFSLEKEIQSYGDAVYSIYFDQSLSEGKSGVMMFTGHGYSGIGITVNLVINVTRILFLTPTNPKVALTHKVCLK